MPQTRAYARAMFSRERRCGMNFEMKSLRVTKAGFPESLN